MTLQDVSTLIFGISFCSHYVFTLALDLELTLTLKLLFMIAGSLGEHVAKDDMDIYHQSRKMEG